MLPSQRYFQTISRGPSVPILEALRQVQVDALCQFLGLPLVLHSYEPWSTRKFPNLKWMESLAIGAPQSNP